MSITYIINYKVIVNYITCYLKVNIIYNCKIIILNWEISQIYMKILFIPV